MRVACEDCGRPYLNFQVDTVLPDRDWKAITGRSDGGGLLCAGCIAARVARLRGVQRLDARIVYKGTIGPAHSSSEGRSRKSGDKS